MAHQGSKRFVRLYFAPPSPAFTIEVAFEDERWITGYEVDRDGDRISRRGKFDQRFHKVEKAAIARLVEYRENLTYATLEPLKGDSK
jgi:hypothetical protein